MGIHPYWAATSVAGEGGQSFTEELFNQVKKAATHPNVVAIGECGLDFSAHFPPAQEQLPWFERQVELAVEVRTSC